MWTRAPPFTSDHAVVPSCLALDQEAEAGEAACCPRLHHNHQPGEQEPLEYHHYHAVTTHTLALDYSYPTSSHPASRIHHDPPEATGSSKRFPTEGFTSKRSRTKHQHSHMSSPESTSVLARDRELLLPEANTKLGSCSIRVRERRQLDDMQTQTTRNASSDQEVPELVASSSPPKRRRVLLFNEFVKPKDSPHFLAPGDHSGVTAEQLMADLDSSSKASTPDCQVPASVEAADQLAAPQCSSTPPGKQVVEQEANHNVESNVTLEQSSRQRDPHPSDDDTQSTSQNRIWVPHSQPSRHCSKTMASRGSDEWLQLSLGSGVQSEETPPEDRHGESPTGSRNPPTSADAPPGGGIRDFFRFGSESEAHQSSSPVTPMHRQQYSGTPEFSVPRPLTFLEPRVRSSRDSPWLDPNVGIPRGEGQFLSPSPVVQQQQRPAFSNLATLPYHPARALQLVRSEQTDTTSVHASPWMGVQHPQHEAPRTPPEFLSMGTPGAFRDWRSAGASAASPGSFLSMQPPLAQGVDPEQAWRNLLQRVGGNLSVPSGFGAAGASSSSGRGEPMMLPLGEREEYLDALTRAVERFQGADQGGKDDSPLTELQRLQRNAMFPPGQRPHLGPSFDPSTDISMARYFNASSSSGSKPRAPAPATSSDRQRRILRPHAPRPGLWFTLQASNSQPEASPLQQIPTAYIRVVDDTMTVAAVRRYLVTKLGLASEDEVELTCRGQPLQPSLPLSQVRDGIWQSPNTNTPTPSTPQLLSEGKAWKAPDGSITLVGDVVMVLTYGRRPPAPPPTST